MADVAGVVGSQDRADGLPAVRETPVVFPSSDRPMPEIDRVSVENFPPGGLPETYVRPAQLGDGRGDGFGHGSLLRARLPAAGPGRPLRSSPRASAQGIRYRRSPEPPGRGRTGHPLDRGGGPPGGSVSRARRRPGTAGAAPGPGPYEQPLRLPAGAAAPAAAAEAGERVPAVQLEDGVGEGETGGGHRWARSGVATGALSSRCG